MRKLEELGMILTALCDLALPRVCVVCGRRLLLYEKHVCYGCLCDVPFTRFWLLKHNAMADKFNERIKASIMDGEGEGYAFAAALFFYNSESPYKNIPWDLKYRHSIAQGRYFSRILGKELSGSDIFSDVGVVIPVPLHWSRKLKRGYNQAEIIASEIASALNAKFLPKGLRRTRRTVTQTKMDVMGKTANVSGAFELSPKYLSELSNAAHILLVDDTFTTGATLSSCFAALRKSLPSSIRISCATLDYVVKG